MIEYEKGVDCIGRFGGGYGTWYAEMHWDEGVVKLFERSKGGPIEVATILLAGGIDEDEPASPQSQRLMWIVNAKQAFETLNAIQKSCAELEEELGGDRERNMEDIFSAWELCVDDIGRETQRILDSARINKE